MVLVLEAAAVAAAMAAAVAVLDETSASATLFMQSKHLPEPRTCYDRVSKDIARQCNQHPDIRTTTESYCPSKLAAG